MSLHVSLLPSAEDGNLNISPSMFSEFYNQDQGIFTADYVFDAVN